mgnify:CR=1 FL=1
MAVPLNPDLPSSWEIPGVFFSINLFGQGAGVGALDKRLLLLGHRLSTGTMPPDQPVLVNGQADANQFFGRGSDLARMVAAALSQVGGGVLDVWCCGINDPAAGTLATHLITVAGTATASGSVDAYICGYRASISIASGDTATTVAANLLTEINKLLDLPVTAAAVAGVITLTARHRGLVGNDLPVRVDQVGGAGITFSPGTLTYAVAAAGAGSATVSVSTTVISTPITDLDAAATIAANVAAQINAGGYPVTASVAGAVVTLLYARDRYVHRIAAAIVTSGGTTVTPAVGVVVADAGAQRPTLTTALTNLAGLNGFSGWSPEFIDVTTLGTISTHIEQQGDGRRQKGQMVHVAATTALAVAGAIPPGTTPLLTASPRYSLAWCPESPQQAYELAARTAAMVCAEDYAPRNYDGKPLKTDATVPLLLPPRAIRPSQDDQNAAIHTYFMTPLAVDEIAGTLDVVSGKTTSSSQDGTLHDWGTIRHIDFLRQSFSARLSSVFAGTNLRRNGTPHTANTVTVISIRDQAFLHATVLDAVDLYDGAEAFKDGFRAEPDAILPGRVNCFVPLAVIRSLHQIGAVGAPV